MGLSISDNCGQSMRPMDLNFTTDLRTILSSPGGSQWNQVHIQTEDQAKGRKMGYLPHDEKFPQSSGEDSGHQVFWPFSHHEMVSPQRLRENKRKFKDSTGLEECRAGHYISDRPLNGQESFLDRGWVWGNGHGNDHCKLSISSSMSLNLFFSLVYNQNTRGQRWGI